MHEPIEVLRPVTQGEWTELVRRTESDHLDHDARRTCPRKAIECFDDIQLKISEFGEVLTRIAKFTEISAGGVTCWTKDEVPEGVKVEFVFAGDYLHWLVKGRIVHCTQTVGGYKVGIRIEFSK